MIIGKKLRELREEKGLLLRQVAAKLEVDTAFVSKIERGEKNIRKEHLLKIAELYQSNTKELVAIWLADRVINILKDEDGAAEALQIVAQKLKNQ